MPPLSLPLFISTPALPRRPGHCDARVLIPGLSVPSHPSPSLGGFLHKAVLTILKNASMFHSASHRPLVSLKLSVVGIGLRGSSLTRLHSPPCSHGSLVEPSNLRASLARLCAAPGPPCSPPSPLPVPLQLIATVL